MKKLIFLLTVFIIVGISIFIRIKVIEGQTKIKRLGAEAIQLQNGIPVQTTLPRRDTFTIWRELPGKIQGNKQAFIKTPDAARVAKIRYKIGDFVKADTPIISLDENDPRNMSKVKLLRTVYEDSLRDYDRYQNLFKSGGVSKDVVDKMYLKLQAARTNLDSASATVHLTSPFDGILLALYTRVGENTEPDKTLAIVSSLKKVRVVIAVSDHDIEEIKTGQLVRVSSNDKILTGKVDRISLGANPDTGLFDVELLVNNKENLLKVGMYVIAQVRVYHKPMAIFIPNNCILSDADNKSYVFQVQNNNAKRVPVSILKTNDHFSIVQGINPALSLIQGGVHNVRDDSRLLIENKVGK